MSTFWAFDFDQTISILHTFHNNIDARKQTIEERRKNIRDCAALKLFILQRYKQGDAFAVVTYHSDKKHIELYLEALLGEGWSDIFRSIQYNDGRHNRPLEEKNSYILSAIQVMGMSIDTFGKENIVLVDDDLKNVQAAQRYGFSAVLATPGENYISKLHDIIASDSNYSPGSSTLYSSQQSKENQPLLEGQKKSENLCCCNLL